MLWGFPAAPAVFGGQLPDSGKQFIIDRGKGKKGAGLFPCFFCVKIPLGLVTEFLQKVFSFAISLAARQCYHTAKPSRRALPQPSI